MRRRRKMPVTEQQLESSTASNSDVETEDDSYLQLMQQYSKAQDQY